jgi:hypothetical protein
MRKVPLLVVAALALAPVRPADACDNAVLLESSEMAKRVASAEQALMEGNYLLVLRKLDGRGHWLEGDRETKLTTLSNDPALNRRALLVVATAAIRDGRYRIHRDLGIAQLDELLASDRDNPILRARLAEGLVLRDDSPEDRREAAEILVDLERRDLVPEAEAWAALARLRKGKDLAGYTRAVMNCQKLSRRQDVCPKVPGTK